MALVALVAACGFVVPAVSQGCDWSIQYSSARAGRCTQTRLHGYVQGGSLQPLKTVVALETLLRCGHLTFPSRALHLQASQNVTDVDILNFGEPPEISVFPIFACRRLPLPTHSPPCTRCPNKQVGSAAPPARNSDDPWPCSNTQSTYLTHTTTCNSRSTEPGVPGGGVL